MKIRNGWVGNSSSSSFIIFGFISDINDKDDKLLQEYLKDTNFTYEEFIDSDDIIWDYSRYLQEKLGNFVEVFYNENYSYNEVYIGVDPNQMNDNETKLQFKNRIIDYINTKLNKKDIILPNSINLYYGEFYDG